LNIAGYHDPKAGTTIMQAIERGEQN